VTGKLAAALVVLLAAPQAWAQPLQSPHAASTYFGVGVFQAAQSYGSSPATERSLTQTSATIEGAFLTSSPFGLFGLLDLGYVMAASDGGAPLVLSNYPTRLFFASLIGGGLRLTPLRSLALTVAVGAHLSGSVLSSGDPTLSSNTAFTAGIGASARADLVVEPGYGLYLSVLAAYDALPIFDTSSSSFRSGYVAGGALGFLLRM
jgi:hypothetical protein